MTTPTKPNETAAAIMDKLHSLTLVSHDILNSIAGIERQLNALHSWTEDARVVLDRLDNHTITAPPTQESTESPLVWWTDNSGRRVLTLRTRTADELIDLIDETNAKGLHPQPTEPPTPTAQPEPKRATPKYTECPNCGGEIWVNAPGTKGKNGKPVPLFKCKDSQCDWKEWPPKEKK